MDEKSRPRIEFPCRYPVKVMGANEGDFAGLVFEIARRHAPELLRQDMSIRASRNGRWLSVTLMIEAQSEAQLRALHADLEASGRVDLVL